MIVAGIIMAALAAIGFIISLSIENSSNNEGYTFIGWLCGGFFALGLCMVAVEANKTDKPSAMDVYQGKTTLEYTVVDGVATDSTVVWKDVRS